MKVAHFCNTFLFLCNTFYPILWFKKAALVCSNTIPTLQYIIATATL